MASLVQTLIVKGKKVGAIDADFSNPNLGRMLKVSGGIVIPDKKLERFAHSALARNRRYRLRPVRFLETA